MSAISREQATKEITAWLDYKKIKDSQREANKPQVDAMIDAMEAGTISMDENTYAITQKLDVPDSVGSLFTDLTYKARISIGELQRATSAVKATDFDGKITGYISALTGKPFSHIQKLDSEDYKIGQAIAVFFM